MAFQWSAQENIYLSMIARSSSLHNRPWGGQPVRVVDEESELGAILKIISHMCFTMAFIWTADWISAMPLSQGALRSQAEITILENGRL